VGSHSRIPRAYERGEGIAMQHVFPEPVDIRYGGVLQPDWKEEPRSMQDACVVRHVDLEGA
jgi:hypothetical protein